ncbi:MAG: glycerophosphodiester phosphodiesterase [Betaproteobacteria bacterium]|nr:glycerophosphodiester phosphodiesterase [Betaproteobacteria bacterium]
MRLWKTHACVLGAIAALTQTAQAEAAFPTLDGSDPIVIGHRGASGYRPEHTLASYSLAIELGANYIEPDLVSTKDGVLIVRHEPNITNTTNVSLHPEFADRYTTKIVDGVSESGWFASDFTLAEIKTLRAIQTRGRSTTYDGLYEIPTLQEVIDLAKARSIATGRTIGIYPETKHPTFHDSIGLSLEEPLVQTLNNAGWSTSAAPVFIQSFEVSNLQQLNTMTDVKLVQLMDAWDVKADGTMELIAPYAQPYDFVVAGDSRTFADLLTEEGLDFIATYADGVGPWKPYLLKTVDDGVDRDGNGVLDARDRLVIGSTGVIEDAHERGLLVHTWTFRDDNIGYQLGFETPTDEYKAFYAMGIDGVFSDFPDTAVAAIPEPETYALMLGGLGLIAAVRRRRGGRN